MKEFKFLASFERATPLNYKILAKDFKSAISKAFKIAKAHQKYTGRLLSLSEVKGKNEDF
jgi:hypothetical protein